MKCDTWDLSNLFVILNGEVKYTIYFNNKTLYFIWLSDRKRVHISYSDWDWEINKNYIKK